MIMLIGLCLDKLKCRVVRLSRLPLQYNLVQEQSRAAPDVDKLQANIVVHIHWGDL